MQDWISIFSSGLALLLSGGGIAAVVTGLANRLSTLGMK